jgi:hypothetical protein
MVCSRFDPGLAPVLAGIAPEIEPQRGCLIILTTGSCAAGEWTGLGLPCDMAVMKPHGPERASRLRKELLPVYEAPQLGSMRFRSQTWAGDEPYDNLAP